MIGSNDKAPDAPPENDGPHPAPVARGTQTIVAAYYFALFGAFGVYLPSFPPWLEAHGIRGIWLGFALALWPALGVVGPPLLGAIADSFDVRERLLTYCTFGAGLSFLAVALSAGVLGSVVGTFFALALFAFARSPLVTLSDAIALEALGPRRERYGKLRLFGSIGFLVAALGVGHLVRGAGTVFVPAAVGGFFLAAGIVSLLLPRARAGLARRTPIAWRDIRVGRRLLVVLLLGQAAHSAFDTTFAIHARAAGIAPSLVGVLFAVGIVAEVLFFLAARRIVARLGAERTLLVGLVGAAVRWVATSQATGFAALLALQPLHALSFAATWAATIEIVGARAKPGRIAVSQGITAAAIGLGAVLGILAAGAIYERVGTSNVFVAGAVTAAVAALVALRLRPEEAPREGFAAGPQT